MDKRTGLPGPLVETEWLAAHLNDPHLRVLDCSVAMHFAEDGSYSFSSGEEEWRKGHVPGSDFVDLLSELSDGGNPVPLMMPPVDDFVAIMEAHGVADDTHVVLYDRLNHAWAARVWWMLRACGFDDAGVLNGGWNKWAAEGRAVSTGAASYPKGSFTPHPRPGLMVTKDEVRAALGNESISIINALSPESFRGEASHYERPGRIPGSKNVFCQALVDPETHTYIDLEQQREMFQQTGALDAERVITYCGGGIAASSDAFALTLLGVKDVAVYDGSLSEWTADPSMPMETG